jgi:hypothetical protein
MTTRFSAPAGALLASYPHVSDCSACLRYAADAMVEHSATAVLSATLAHHDSYHSSDPLLTACQHFAVEDEPTLA